MLWLDGDDRVGSVGRVVRFVRSVRLASVLSVVSAENNDGLLKPIESALAGTVA